MNIWPWPKKGWHGRGRPWFKRLWQCLLEKNLKRKRGEDKDQKRRRKEERKARWKENNTANSGKKEKRRESNRGRAETSVEKRTGELTLSGLNLWLDVTDRQHQIFVGMLALGKFYIPVFFLTKKILTNYFSFSVLPFKPSSRFFIIWAATFIYVNWK